MAVMNPYNYAKPKNFIRTEPSSVAVIAEKKPQSAVGEKLDQYLENRVLSAKPEELTYMLYEGLVKFIKKAMFALEEKKYERVNYNTQRAQAIVDELRSTLNMDVALSMNLDALYEYLAYKLMTANVDKDAQQFEEALEIAEGFRDTWRQAFGLK